MTDKPETNDPELDSPANPEDAPELGSADSKVEPAAAEPEAADADSDEVDDPGGADGEADEEASAPRPRPPAKLERLQKILAQAGVSSRRRAEELITQGRVQVNGTTVTELGTKADAGRDHIRVDGKLLQGAERLRYFVLNKPKGFVTTVKDPEGRPTVMKFFEKMRERLYPVGRLDYMSEGLLLVTNDGELANRLTKAASGVEKTYLVKVAGQPTEAELEILRGGVDIDRGQPGTERVRTAPARIRQVRQGDNPWYEVVLIEGRNRELRKMFEEVGHFVEKIRRVGYGPLVLDQEPGNLRELEPAELDALRKAAEGKYRTPKSKDVRRRNAADAGLLPTVKPKPSARPSARPAPPSDRFAPRPPAADRFGDADPAESRKSAGPRAPGPKREFGSRAVGQGNARPSRPTRPDSSASSPTASKSGSTRPPARSASRPFSRPAERGAGRPAAKFADRPASRPPFKRAARPPARSAPGPDTRTNSPRPPAGRSFPPKPAWKRPEAGSRPPYKRPNPRPNAESRDDFASKKPSQLHIEPVERTDYADRPSRTGPSRSGPGRSGPGRSRPSGSGSGPARSGRSGFSRPPTSREPSDRPGSSGSGFRRPQPSGPASGRSNPARPSFDRPARSESGLSRPFTTSSGKPRAGGARPSTKPGGKSGKPPFQSGGRPPAGSASGWKPKPGLGGKPRSGGFRPPSSRPASRSGPRPGGKRPGPSRGKRT